MQPEVGAVLEGKISGIAKFGAFVTLQDGKTGLVHISEIANAYVSDIAQYCSVGQTVRVKVIGINGEKLNLSMKQALPAQEEQRRQQTKPQHRPQRPSTAEPVAAAAPPTEDQTFEDKLKQFMKDSDSRIADNRRYSDRGRSKRRK